MSNSSEIRETVQESVSEEFTRTGLREHVLSFINEESYCDESLYSICEEFNYRLMLKSQGISNLLKGWGTEFTWAINTGIVIYAPAGAWNNYNYVAKHGVKYSKLDALLAFIRDDINIDALVNDYWSNRSPSKVWAKEYETLGMSV